MSGIFGLWRLDGRPVERDALDAMSRRLDHRGPDGAGAWRSGPVGIGQRMLRTTPEAERETLPLETAGGALVLTSDARLDNRPELVAALGLTGPPGDPTDADLILASYRAWGERCAERWIGDFAVAIWDASLRRLFCVRDPFGLKPFYYHHAPGRLFAFASEVEALLALTEVPDEINDYEVARHVQIPLGGDASTTYFAHIRRLLPAHALAITERSVVPRRYWQPDPARELKLADDGAYADALREVFVEAVRCRVRSRTPVASMLSGGIDSAAVTCVAADLLEREGGPPLQALSAVFPSAPESDERVFIESVLDRYPIVPHFFAADAADPIADIDRINRLVGGANWGGNLYLNWVLYGAAARSGARVVLDGFDGDTTVSHGTGYLSELAMSGRWLKLAPMSIAYSRRRGRPVVPDLVSLVRLGVRHPTRETAAGSLVRRLRRRDPPRPAPPGVLADRHRLLNADFAARFAERVVTDPDPPETEREFHLRKLSGLALLEGIGWLEACAAGCGAEVRLPFCDVRLVELCLSFPADQKLRRGWTRYVMRRSMEGILPAAIQWRRGKSSLHQGREKAWRANQNGRIETLLAHPTPTVTRYLDPVRVLELHRRSLAGETDGREDAALWRALSLALWLSTRSG
ncbi:MAG TPA: asparagine synthase-related protein [Gemmatimonadota bacterium]|jgi:asparagine synthase (glutamine-hydrolysing)